MKSKHNEALYYIIFSSPLLLHLSYVQISSSTNNSQAPSGIENLSL
jgi:hypothetical protein